MTLGHNNPPSAIDEITAGYADAIAEAENWLDGTKVENEGQMKQVDALLKSIKAAIKAVKEGEESEAKPVYDEWKRVKALWKPTIDDLDKIAKGLVAISADFKKRLADEKRAAERAAWDAANRARMEAEAAASQADAGDIDAQREAEAMRQAAIDAEKEAQAAKRDQVKGMRKVTRYEITDHRAALHDIARNDRDAVTAFIEEYVRRNHKARAIDGVNVWEEKEAF